MRLFEDVIRQPTSENISEISYILFTTSSVASQNSSFNLVNGRKQSWISFVNVERRVVEVQKMLSKPFFAASSSTARIHIIVLED